MNHPKLDNEDSEYLLLYINNVLLPASKEFFDQIKKNEVKLHHAFSFNAILAHAIDYMVFIAKKLGSATRTEFINGFDKKYSVDGAEHINNKFRLLDAINNSFKHVELDTKQTRYKDLIEKYGELTFHSLKEKDGKVYFEMPSFRFDYCRVVLRPISTIFDCGLKNSADVDDFVNGRLYGSSGYGNFDYEYEPWDAIDRMIDYCSAPCMDCGEHNECECSHYNYGENKGEYRPDQDPSFELSDVMSQISGTREWSK
jgi:hypothetical protein